MKKYFFIILCKHNKKNIKLKSDKLSKVTMQVTGACSWRPPDIKHKKNEIYIDVVESVNLLVSVDGL